MRRDEGMWELGWKQKTLGLVKIEKVYEGQTPRAPRHFALRIVSASCLPAKRNYSLRAAELRCDEMARNEK